MTSSLTIVDFGAFAGDLVLFGGPYSNRQALEALIDAVPGGGPAICTGDSVAYCGDPVATVARLRGTGWPVIAGNCERQLAAGQPDCGCGFAEGTACDRLAQSWYGHADARIGDGDRAWMAGLPDIGLFHHAGRRGAVLHGGATAINRFLWPSSPDRDFETEIAAVSQACGPVDMIVAGHCGIAFQRVIAGVHWINAGAIGLPPHDGRPETRYGVLTADGVRFCRLSYDIAAAVAAMDGAGLGAGGYRDSLISGWWPSEDILPAELRRA